MKKNMAPGAGFEPARGYPHRLSRPGAWNFDGRGYGTGVIAGSMGYGTIGIEPLGTRGVNPFARVDLISEIDAFLAFAQNKYTAKKSYEEVRLYSRYLKYLVSFDIFAKIIMNQTPGARRHILKVCSIFAKYLDGKYVTEEFTKAFQIMRKRLGLKWTTPKRVKTIIERLEKPEEIASKIIANIENPKHQLFTIFMLAAGLRSKEAEEAWEGFLKYYRQINGIHMVEIMKIRKTKRAYFAFITPNLAFIMLNLEALRDNRRFQRVRKIDLTEVWDSWKKACQKAGYDHRAYPLYYLRKVNATLLRRVLDQEMVNLLQGRVPETVLDQYYNVESLQYLYEKYMETVGRLVDRLLLKLEAKITVKSSSVNQEF